MDNEVRKNRKKIMDLCKAIASLKDSEECRKLLEDLCTPGEIAAMADRWQVAQMLDEGTSYRKIYELSGVSTATVTRVARAMSYGANGYKLILERNRNK